LQPKGVWQERGARIKKNRQNCSCILGAFFWRQRFLGCNAAVWNVTNNPNDFFRSEHSGRKPPPPNETVRGASRRLIPCSVSVPHLYAESWNLVASWVARQHERGMGWILHPVEDHRCTNVECVR